MRNTSRAGSLEPDVKRFGELMLSLGRLTGLRDPLAGECSAERNLTASQIHALIWLGHDGPLTMGELAHLVCVTEKTITGIVDRLERDSFLQRTRDQSDRRVVRVALTAKGASEFRALDDHIRGRLEQALGHLEPADRDTLFRILEKLRDRVASSSPEPASKETK